MRPLIVGEAPGPSGNAARPLEGRCGQTLACYAGLRYKDYLAAFDRTNVLSAWPGPNGKGSAFDSETARREAFKMRRRLLPGRIVLLLGKRLARAFCVKPDYLVEQPLGRSKAYVLPHPSGVNRWFNDPVNRSALTAFMEALVPGGIQPRSRGEAQGGGLLRSARQSFLREGGRQVSQKEDSQAGEQVPSKPRGQMSDAQKAAVAAGVKAWWVKRKAAAAQEPSQ